MGVLVASVATATLLNRRRTEMQAAELVAYAERARMDPVQLVLWGARANTIVLLGDVAGLTAPKRIAARAIDALARGPGLDAVVLDVPESLQPVIDRYLESDPEDAGLLAVSPGALPSASSVAHAYLQIYRAVWRFNQTVGPARRIRIVAAGLPTDGAAAGVRAPHVIASQYARRDEHMMQRTEEEVLQRSPGARVLVFAEGYHVLQRGRGRLHFAGGMPIDVIWLGARLAARHPTQVFSILIDRAPASAGLGIEYTATRVADLLRKGVWTVTAPFGVPLDRHFDFVREPIHTAVGPGLRLEILPDGYRLRELADGYIYLQGGSR